MDTIIGIPGTLSDSVKRIKWIRRDVTLPHPLGPRARCYEAQTDEGLLRAIVNREQTPDCDRPLWHISVSFRDKAGDKTRVPTWDELKHAAYRLIPEDVCMILLFPRRSAPYVNINDTCLHLWELEKPPDGS